MIDRPMSYWDMHKARAQDIRAALGDGAATTDDLRDVLDLIEAITEALAREEINRRMSYVNRG